ncbi:MAG: cytochrome P450 [Candidatus Azotimanducaceae bacterium]
MIPAFIEEALRYYSPFSATVRRTTKEIELAGIVIPKGDLVLPLIASANRDEHVFDQPDSFQIDRNPNPSSCPWIWHSLLSRRASREA